MKNAQIYINGVPIKKATGISLLPRRSLWQKIKDKINFYKGRRKLRGKITWAKRFIIIWQQEKNTAATATTAAAAKLPE